MKEHVNTGREGREARGVNAHDGGVKLKTSGCKSGCITRRSLHFVVLFLKWEELFNRLSLYLLSTFKKISNIRRVGVEIRPT